MITIPQLRKMIEKAITEQSRIAVILGTDENPQIKEMAAGAKARKDALLAVRDAMNNDRVMLNIMGGC